MARDEASVIRHREEFNSLTLFRAGVNFAKRHYLLTTVYIVGLLVLQFATGFAVSPEQRVAFDSALAKIDLNALEQAKERAYFSQFGHILVISICIQTNLLLS